MYEIANIIHEKLHLNLIEKYVNTTYAKYFELMYDNNV